MATTSIIVKITIIYMLSAGAGGGGGAAADMQAARKSESFETTGSHKIHDVLQLRFAGVSGAWNWIVAVVVLCVCV